MQQRCYDPEIGSFLSGYPVTAASHPVELFSRYRHANSDPEVNSGRSVPLGFEAFVGLTSGKMHGWSYLQIGGKTHANVKYSTPWWAHS